MTRVVREFSDKYKLKSVPQIFAESVSKTFGLDRPGGALGMAAPVTGATQVEVKFIEQLKKLVGTKHAYGKQPIRGLKLLEEGKATVWEVIGKAKGAYRTWCDTVIDMAKGAAPAAEEAAGQATKPGLVDRTRSAIRAGKQAFKGEAEAAGAAKPPTPPTPPQGGEAAAAAGGEAAKEGGWLGRLAKRHKVGTAIGGVAMGAYAADWLKETGQKKGYLPRSKASPEQEKAIRESYRGANVPESILEADLASTRIPEDVHNLISPPPSPQTGEPTGWHRYAMLKQMDEEQEKQTAKEAQHKLLRQQYDNAMAFRQRMGEEGMAMLAEQLARDQERRRLNLEEMIAPYTTALQRAGQAP